MTHPGFLWRAFTMYEGVDFFREVDLSLFKDN